MKRALAVFLSILLPSTTAAQEIIPTWHMVEKKACYDFESSRLLLKLDEELVAGRKLKLSHDALLLAVSDFETALRAQKEATKLLDDNRVALELQLKAAITAKAKAEANRMPGMGWTIAGVLTLLVTGVVAGWAIEHYALNPKP